MKRICNLHGLHSEKRCPKCNKQRNLTYDRYKRDQQSDKFYHSTAWKKVREIVLKSEPMCRMCKIKPATIVDHIIPIRKGGEKLNLENLQPLCHQCHNIKTAAEREGWV